MFVPVFSSPKCTNNIVSVLDTVTLGNNLVIHNQSIGVASTAQGFNNGIDGILGIGPVDLTTGKSC
jgi:hypothetical protein